MEKITAAIMTLIMILSLTACGQNPGEDGSDVNSSENTSVTQEASQTVAEVTDTKLQEQWNGTWYGCMHVIDNYDCYMIVEVDEAGKGRFAVYLDDADDALALGTCEATEHSLNATGGTVAGGTEMNTNNWMFLPMPDYPDQYTMGDSLEDGEGSFDFTLFMKKWGGSWQKEIDSDFAIVPPSIESYNKAIENGELPPIGFAPIGYESNPASDAQQPVTTDASAKLPEVEPSSSDENASKSEFAGEISVTIDEFMTGVKTTVTLTLPDTGWCYKNTTNEIFVYNVPSLDEQNSGSPIIKIASKETLEKLNFYYSDFENVKEIADRTIGGVSMKGRTYDNVGMSWTEYYGELPNGIWMSISISKIDLSEGSEGDAVLNTIKIK